MYSLILTALVASLSGFAIATPLASTGKPAGHVNTAPYGGPDTFFEGYAEAHAAKNATNNAPPGHVNKAPYGGPNTFFEGLAEAQHLNKSLNARTSIAGVYWCDEEEWQGHCGYTITSGGKCHPWVIGSFSSLGPDHGIRCIIYSGKNCDGGHYYDGFVYPGTPVLEYYDGTIWPQGGWTTQSYRCHWL